MIRRKVHHDGVLIETSDSTLDHLTENRSPIADLLPYYNQVILHRIIVLDEQRDEVSETVTYSVEPTTDAEKIEQIRTLLNKPSGLMAYNTLTQIREILDQK